MVGQANVQHSSTTPKAARDYLDMHSSQTNRLTRYQRCIVFSYQPDRPSFYALHPTQCAPGAKAADNVQDMMDQLGPELPASLNQPSDHDLARAPAQGTCLDRHAGPAYGLILQIGVLHVGYR
jgi:hypothetical protein